MAHILIAVMPLDTHLSHLVQHLKHEGFQHMGFIIGNPVATDEAQLGVAPAPETAAVMQLLAPDTGFPVKDLGYLTVAGSAGELAQYRDRDAHDFLTALLGHDADTQIIDAVKTALHDGHAVLTIEGDVARARDMIKNTALFLHGG